MTFWTDNPCQNLSDQETILLNFGRTINRVITCIFNVFIESSKVKC